MNDLLDSPLQDSGKRFRFKLWVPLIWLTICFIGVVFRFMHWPFASGLYIIGFGGFAAYNFNAVFRLKGKQIVNDVFVGLSVLWIIVLIWGAISNGGYPLNFNGLAVQAISLVVLNLIYLLAYLIIYRKRK